MRIGIAGGGLLGRLAAFHLTQAGHEVSVFEASPSPSPGPNQLRAAAWTAAGMLSPIAEMECGGPMVRDWGRRSLTLWQELDSELKRLLTPHGLDSHGLTEHPEHTVSPLGLQLHDSLMVCHASDLGAAQRVLRLLDNDPQHLIQLEGRDIVPLAPAIKGTLHAWRLKGEGHLCPPLAMESLHRAMPGVHWRWGAQVSDVRPHSLCIQSEETRFDWVLDTRGTGAANQMAVRGVRGEVIVLSAPEFELHRPVRLLHPRWRVYIVPHPGGRLVVGATEIESEDRSPISVQSTMELLSAAFSIFPSLAEARIVHTDVNLRPAMMDNLPHTDTQPGITRINGLFRHGWLLAPAVLENALHDADLC